MSTPVLSFEVFAPHDEAGEKQLQQTLPLLAAANPGLITVTYVGIGEETRDRTLRTAKYLAQVLPAGIDIGVHITRVGLDRENIKRFLDELEWQGVSHIVALGGNKPEEGQFQYDDAELYATTDKMIEDIHIRHPKFGISAAAFPGREGEIENLQRKEEAGATRAYTQYSRALIGEEVLGFARHVEFKGIKMPIVPGLMHFSKPVEGREKDAQGVPIPPWVHSLYKDASAIAARHGIHKSTLITAVSRASSITQLEYFKRQGAPNIHYYTMNRANCLDVIAAAYPEVARGWELPNGTSLAGVRGWNLG